MTRQNGRGGKKRFSSKTFHLCFPRMSDDAGWSSLETFFHRAETIGRIIKARPALSDNCFFLPKKILFHVGERGHGLSPSREFDNNDSFAFHNGKQHPQELPFTLSSPSTVRKIFFQSLLAVDKRAATLPELASRWQQLRRTDSNNLSTTFEFHMLSHCVNSWFGCLSKEFANNTVRDRGEGGGQGERV